MPWYRDQLGHIDIDKLDDLREWQKIPILDKDMLRRLSHAELLEAFCAVPVTGIAEYWRSGGSTGQPVFYPRTSEDLRFAELSWGRSFPCIGIGAGDLCHISFPLGVHPAGKSGRAARRCSAWEWCGSVPAMPIPPPPSSI